MPIWALGPKNEKFSKKEKTNKQKNKKTQV